MACKGTCYKYVDSVSPSKGGRYSQGQSRCQKCSVWIKWDGYFYPCCNYRLRKNPRTMQQKEIIRNKKLPRI